MSFRGIVTRKDTDTGVDLLAKIVTANKKKSTKKIYKVRVASNGLSDAEACGKAVSAKKYEIEHAGPGGSDDLTVSINLNENGLYQTKLTYVFKSDNEDNPITDYLSKNGTLLGSPIFGMGDATGKIYITATRGPEDKPYSVTAIVPITIKAYTAESILADDTIISKSGLWKAMTSNAEFNLANNRIKFLSTWEPWKLMNPKPSNHPIIVTYEVEDRLQTSIGQPRIDTNTAGDKIIYEPSYSIMKGLQGTSSEFTITESRDFVQAGKTSKSLICDGLIVTATLTLGEAYVTYEYNISTHCASLTNEEIIRAIENLSEPPTARGNKASSVLRLYKANDVGVDLGGYFMNATAPEAKSGVECYNINATAVVGQTFGVQCVTTDNINTVLNLDSLGLPAEDVSLKIDPPVIKAFNGVSEYLGDESLTNAIFSVIEGTNIVNVGLGLIKSYTDNDPSSKDDVTGFSISQLITCNGYEGTPKTLKLMKWFYISRIEDLV